MVRRFPYLIYDWSYIVPGIIWFYHTILYVSLTAATIPEFVSGLKKCHAQQGKSAKFECEVSGSPTPDIQWFKGTRELYDGGKYEIYNEGDKQILVVHDVFGEDQDEYSCKASNPGGNRVSRANLEISCKIFKILNLRKSIKNPLLRNVLSCLCWQKIG